MDSLKPEFKAAYQAAIQSLSRREYSAKELGDKLRQQGHDSKLVSELLTELANKDYQSDKRYCEMLVRTRARQHYGPTKIAYELKQKGVAENLINIELSKYEDDWPQIIAELIAKKQRGSKTFTDDKLIKFLMSKGFNYGLVKKVLKTNA